MFQDQNTFRKLSSFQSHLQRFRLWRLRSTACLRSGAARRSAACGRSRARLRGGCDAVQQIPHFLPCNSVIGFRMILRYSSAASCSLRQVQNIGYGDRAGCARNVFEEGKLDSSA